MSSIRAVAVTLLSVLLIVVGATALPATGTGRSTAPAATGPAPDLYRLAWLQPTGARKLTRITIKRVSTPPSGDFGWSVDTVDPASRVLRISWTDSPDVACGQADQVQVHETKRSVVIGVKDTRLRLPVACSAVGLGHVTRVQLQRPLGRRALVVPLQASDVTGTTKQFRSTLMRSPDTLPRPGCDPSAAPAGMTDARTRLAPAEPTTAVLCRVSWSRGQDRITRVTIKDPARAAALAARITSTMTDLHPSRTRYGCDESGRTRYWLTFAGRDLLVLVRTDSPDCGRTTNGAVETPTTPALTDVLEAAFARPAG